MYFESADMAVHEKLWTRKILVYLDLDRPKTEKVQVYNSKLLHAFSVVLGEKQI